MTPQTARFILAGNPRPRIEETLVIGEIARHALMSERFGPSAPPVEFSGRDENGPLRGEPAHAHAFFLPEDADDDGLIDHLIVYCRTGFSDEARRRLDRLTRLWLSHGRANEESERGRKEWRVALEDIAEPEAFSSSLLLGSSRVWISATPYLKNRFDKRRPTDFEALLDTYRKQLAFEWKQRFPNIPPPAVEPLTDSDGTPRSTRAFTRTRAGRGGRQPDTSGGFFRLTFEQNVEGPIALGWGAHFGLGLFRRDETSKLSSINQTLTKLRQRLDPNCGSLTEALFEQRRAEALHESEEP
jgi:CRISPR-associated protein Csb2